MENKITSIELLLENAESYAKTNLDLAKLKAIDTSAEVLSSLVSNIVFAVCVSISIILISVGFAILIGERIENLYYGFFFVACFYLVVSSLLYFLGNILIKTPVSNSIIKQMQKNNEKIKSNHFTQ